MRRPTLMVVSLMLLLAGWLNPLVAQVVASHSDSIQVHIYKAERPQTIVLQGTVPITLFAGDRTNPISELSTDQTLTVTTSNGQLYFSLPDLGNIHARSLFVQQRGDGVIGVDVAAAASPAPMRIYRGDIAISLDPGMGNLKLVNQVHLEDYVAAVLGSELGTNRIEAAKAQAICIRTVALRSLELNGPEAEVPDSDLFQVYTGVEPVTELLLQATMDTKGIVLTHENQLIEAVYSASSGGYTANHAEVWDSPTELPYLQGKRDPYDVRSNHHEWTSEIKRNELHQLMERHYGKPVIDVRVEEQHRTHEGRASHVTLIFEDGTSRAIRSNDFRLQVTQEYGRLRLRSTWFTMVSRSRDYVFTGKGFGHGVGMNQAGADEMARQGSLYNEILNFYYDGVELAHRETGEVMTPQLAGLTAASAQGEGAETILVQRAPVEEKRRRGIKLFNKRKRQSTSSGGRIAW